MGGVPLRDLDELLVQQGVLMEWGTSMTSVKIQHRGEERRACLGW